MPNRLAHETSPYLLQHAHNPVDWYPWGPEALQRAKREDKPILLSVGYSACHWCHVMERESFEDPDIAALMNAHFINIKVDREERPDLDEIYMRAVQAFQRGHGGWPMTVFLTPEGKPWWGGTYFPPIRRGPHPGFPEILQEMRRLWDQHRGEVDRVTGEVLAFLDRSGQLAEADGQVQGDWLGQVAHAAQARFDPIHGGFGGAPKFPPHAILAALLAQSTREPATLTLVTTTLDAMAKGGTYDLLAGGFARYSVDERWLVPHFEKMLYDNAQLVPLYTDAWRLTGRPHYRRIAEETLAWCDREMSLPDGGFAASTDADSEGEEGRYFVWTPAQLQAVLASDAARVAELLQVTDAGTFEHGTSVLRLERPLEDLPPGDRHLLQAALPRLLQARAGRVAPARDDKVITAWNALMISAFARAGFAFDTPALTDRAAVAMEFLLQRMVVDDRLMRTYKDGRAHLPAYADDHAALLTALIDLYEATFDRRWLAQANAWADRTVDLFASDEGPLYYTGHDAEPLISRGHNPIGGSEPGANGLAALGFVRLAHLCGRDDLGTRAERILRAYQPLLQRSPTALGLEALAAHHLLTGGLEVGIAGEPDASRPLLDALRARYLPFAVRAQATPPIHDPLLPWMHGRAEADGQPTAWVCRHHTCKLPVTTAEALTAALGEAADP